MNRLNSNTLNLLQLVDRIYSDTIAGAGASEFLDHVKETLSLSTASIALLDGPIVGTSLESFGERGGLDPDSISFSRVSKHRNRKR